MNTAACPQATKRTWESTDVQHDRKKKKKEKHTQFHSQLQTDTQSHRRRHFQNPQDPLTKNPLSTE